MKTFVIRSFAHKMTAMVLLASSVGVFTLVAGLLVFDRLSSRSQLQNRLTTLADIVGLNSSAALEFSDPAAATEALNALRAEPPVVTACLYAQTGELFAQYHRIETTAACPARRLEIPRAIPGFLSVVRSAMRHSDRVGTVYVTCDYQDVNRQQRTLLLLAAFLFIMAVTIAGTTGSLLQRRLFRRILALATAMHKVTAEQAFSSRVQVAGQDEITQLSSDFNRMVAELERREAEKRVYDEKLLYQAMNDELTGLPNRRLFSDRLAQTLNIARRSIVRGESHIVALLYIDLDGFKLVNDCLGHGTGDALLIQVAGRLQSRVRQSDTLARIGGDEFTVVLEKIACREDAEHVAQKLLDVLVTPFHIDNHDITVGASIGISLFPEHGSEPFDLLQQADSAMYSAKRSGRNRAVYFTPEIGELVRERLSLENQLRGAIQRGEISVYYQPEFEVESGNLVRFEALARWTHPTLGVVPPSKFIPIAEESGMILALGAFVMDRACSDAAQWKSPSAKPIQVAVNVSSIQFSRDQFVQEVASVLSRTGLHPELLQIELTESVMLTGVSASAEKMKQLRALGIGLAIDDFGTGYSCLSYLPTLPFDSLKIDRTFVMQMEAKSQSKAMIHSLVALAHNIGMRVIVEGVERLEQLEMIRAIGGNEVQGYLLGRPTPDPATLLRHLSNNPEDTHTFSAMTAAAQCRYDGSSFHQ